LHLRDIEFPEVFTVKTSHTQGHIDKCNFYPFCLQTAELTWSPRKRGAFETG
jgi:hypothetical protein